MLKLTFIILFLFLLVGCAAQIPKEADEAFYMNNFGKAAKIARPYENKLNRNFALNNAKLGQIYFTGGGYNLAFIPFLNAGKVMERTVTSPGNAFWSAVSREDFKEFKGEPFERSMCHYYRGIIHYKNGDYEKALAAFRRAIDADKDTKSKIAGADTDFAAGYALAARCYYLLGESDNANTLTQKCAEINEDFPFDNTLFVVEWGDSPLKVRDKGGLKCSAFAYFKSRETPIEYAKIFVDGQEKIRINKCTSITYQLSCNTEKTANTIQAIKVGVKWTVRVCAFAGAFAGTLIATKSFVAASGAGTGAALLAGAIVRTEADDRVWNLLPDDIGIGTLNIEPGFHNIAICFYSEFDEELKDWRQVYYYYPIKKNDNLIYSRNLFNRFGSYKFDLQICNSSTLNKQLSSKHYYEIPSNSNKVIRLLPLAPVLWKENQVDNTTVF